MRGNKGFDPNQKFDINIFKRLLKYMLRYKFRYFIIFICIIISAIVQVIGQLFLKTLIDEYITPLIGVANPNFSKLLSFILLMIGIYVTGLLATIIYNRIMVGVSQGVLRDIRNDLFNHLETLPISYFDRNSYGDIMSRFTNDIDTLEMMMSQSVSQVVSSVVSIIAVFISMLSLNIPLTLVVIVGLFLMTRVTKGVIKKSGSYFGSQQKSLGALNGFIEEMTEGQKVIKVFNHEKYAKEDFDKLNEEWFVNSSLANSYGNMVGPITNNIGHLLYVIIALCGGLLAIYTKSFTLGAIASFLSLTNSFTRPIMMITGQFNQVIRAIAGAGRIFEVMDEPEEENDGTVRLVNVRVNNGELIEEEDYTGTWAWKKDDKLILLKGDVRLNNVCFSYEEGKEVLHDISLYAKPGQKIAFVGSTGAGKTTISNLINRFYDIHEGSITYDGINIKEINKKDLRRSLGMVLQDTNLFTGTIMENIRYGNLHASDEECIEAAKLANADHFIRTLPDGYNTKINGNGSSLSQGQRQLLSIARCAVANPPAMILDEATSSIDTRTEKIVQDGMDKLMKGRTVFVIAHRLSTIQNSKAIMVLEHGKIIERGDHEDLIKEHGRYYELYTGKVELD